MGHTPQLLLENLKVSIDLGTQFHGLDKDSAFTEQKGKGRFMKSVGTLYFCATDLEGKRE